MVTLKKKNIFPIVGISICILFLFFLWIKRNTDDDTTICTDITVVSTMEGTMKKDVETVVKHTLKKEIAEIIGEPISNNILQILEKKTEEIPFITSAEVQKKKEIIQISIRFLVPEARIISKTGISYYVSGENIFPFHAIPYDVPLITGNIIEPDFLEESEWRTRFLDFIKTIRTDEFLRAQIVQIYFEKKKNAILIPLVGYQHIILGNLTTFEENLRKLKQFYKEVPYKIDLNNIETIDVSFSGQVICKKRSS